MLTPVSKASHRRVFSGYFGFLPPSPSVVRNHLQVEALSGQSNQPEPTKAGALKVNVVKRLARLLNIGLGIMTTSSQHT